MTLLASPCCKAKLISNACTACATTFAQHDGIPLLLSNTNTRWEAKYQRESEPWDYSTRAVEQLRHDFLERTVASFITPDTRIGEVGCSLGLFSTRLKALSPHVAALDVSPTAAAKTRALTGLEVAAANATSLPFHDASMDLLVLADGLVSWGLDLEERRTAVAQAHRALKPHGHAVFMEYLSPRAHHELEEPVREKFTIEHVAYLDDRLWFIAESMFRAFRDTALYNTFARSQLWAKMLATVSRAFGPHGSKHLCIVARK